MGFFDMMNDFQDARRRAAGIYTEEENAQAYQQLNQQLENQFQMKQQQAYQKAQAENPDADLNIEDFAVDPLQRWQQQVQALVQSGNPVLRKQGESMMDDYRRRSTEKQSMPADPEGVKYAKSIGLKPGTKEFEQFVRDYTAKSGSETAQIQNLRAQGLEPGTPEFNEAMNKLLFPEDKEKESYVTPAQAAKMEYTEEFGGGTVAPYTPVSELRGKVRTRDPKISREIGTGMAIYENLNKQLFDEGGIYEGVGDEWYAPFKLGATSIYNQVIQDDPRYKSYIDNRKGTAVSLAKALGEAGALSNQDVQRAFSLIPNINSSMEGGWIPDSKAVAHRKMGYLKELIQAHSSGSPENVRRVLDSIPNELLSEGDSGYQIGEQRGKYRYIGGDATEPSSWVEVGGE